MTLLNTDVEHALELHRGDRIAQLVIQRVERVRFVEAEQLPGSHRGDGGFGSSGGWKAAPTRVGRDYCRCCRQLMRASALEEE